MLVAILVQLDQSSFEVAFNISYGFQQNQINTTTQQKKYLGYGMKMVSKSLKIDGIIRNDNQIRLFIKEMGFKWKAI